jgi:hypothetical protein
MGLASYSNTPSENRGGALWVPLALLNTTDSTPRAARTLLRRGILARLMSVQGQTRHIHDVRAMSACAPTPEVSLRRGEPTRWAMNDPLHCNKQRTFLPIINSGNPLCCSHAVANHANFWSSAFASFRSSVSKPSVNQP